MLIPIFECIIAYFYNDSTRHIVCDFDVIYYFKFFKFFYMFVKMTQHAFTEFDI